MRKHRLPPNVTAFKDRHGTWRHRFRRKGCKAVYLPGEPWSDPFMEAYRAALKAAAPPPAEIGARKVIPKSVNALAVAFYAAAEFTTQSPSWRTTLRREVERFRASIGDELVAAIRREHVLKMMDRHAATPAAANQRLKVLKILIRFAMDRGILKHGVDPTRGVKRLKIKTSGYRPWTLDDVQTFARHHGPGTKARLALALLLFTAQRRGDVIRMGDGHVKAGRLVFTQGKTGKAMSLPIVPQLAEELARVPAGQKTFLQTAYGKPFTPAGFGMRMQEWVKEAGLKGLSAHGLRKAAATLLANAGRSQKEIGGWTGHEEDSREMRTYIAQADQILLTNQSASAFDVTLAAPAKLKNGTS